MLFIISFRRCCYRVILWFIHTHTYTCIHTEFPKAIADFKRAILLLQKQVVSVHQTHKQTNRDTHNNARKRTTPVRSSIARSTANRNKNSAKHALEALSEGKDETVPAKPAMCDVWEGERGKENVNGPTHTHSRSVNASLAKLKRSSKSTHTRAHTHSLVADVYHNCGYSYFKCNQIDSAIQYLTKSLELHPSNIRVCVCVYVCVCVCVCVWCTCSMCVCVWARLYYNHAMY